MVKSIDAKMYFSNGLARAELAELAERVKASKPLETSSKDGIV